MLLPSLVVIGWFLFSRGPIEGQLRVPKSDDDAILGSVTSLPVSWHHFQYLFVPSKMFLYHPAKFGDNRTNGLDANPGHTDTQTHRQTDNRRLYIWARPRNSVTPSGTVRDRQLKPRIWHYQACPNFVSDTWWLKESVGGWAVPKPRIWHRIEVRGGRGMDCRHLSTLCGSTKTLLLTL